MSLGGMLGGLGLCVGIGSATTAVVVRARAADPGPAGANVVVRGYELFNREWLPNDRRSRGGDGLGPVYNDTSCVACHSTGGIGGAGPLSKNIEILSASLGVRIVSASGVVVERFSSNLEIPKESKTSAFDTLTDLHAGFRTSRTVVLHRFGTDPNYDAWRSRAFLPPAPTIGGRRSVPRIPIAKAPREGSVPEMPPLPSAAESEGRPFGRAAEESPAVRGAARIGEVRASILENDAGLQQPDMSVGAFLVSRSQRNPTPLFGLGLIDAIPDKAIEAMETYQAVHTPKTSGRASRLRDGRIGHLGWKGQTANTEDFVLDACAIELGLEVPGHPQAVSPRAPKYRAPGLDLNADECAALVAYVRSLPRPIERRATNADESNQIRSGRKAFATIGCADCHTPKLGDVDGIYSDLLLHNMDGAMGAGGSYNPGAPSESDDPPLPDPDAGNLAAKRPALTATAILSARRAATAEEWRTPPLWGFRDSGPYLHDGRAQTLEQAVAMHGGQGADSAQKFFELSPSERHEIEVFLRSLAAPPSVQLARRGE
jgi:CxxC motif-containing protein (DUF1111 family)